MTQLLITFINNNMNKETKQVRKNMDIRELAACALFIAIALIFSYVESLLPIPFPVPGMRLGFANIAILSILYMYGPRDAFIVNIARIVLSSLLFGNINSFLFSIAGGLSSLLVMWLFKHFGRFNIISVSAIGGVVHNIAQVLISIWVLGSISIGYLMPLFIVLGLVTGIIIGIVTDIFLKHIKIRGST